MFVDKTLISYLPWPALCTLIVVIPALTSTTVLVFRISLQVRRSLSPISENLSASLPTCTTNGVTVPTHDWLVTVLLPKVSQWCEESSSQLLTAGKSRRRDSIIPLSRYSQLYAELKEKYGPTLVQVHVYSVRNR